MLLAYIGKSNVLFSLASRWRFSGRRTSWWSSWNHRRTSNANEKKLSKTEIKSSFLGIRSNRNEKNREKIFFSLSFRKTTGEYCTSSISNSLWRDCWGKIVVRAALVIFNKNETLNLMSLKHMDARLRFRTVTGDSSLGRSFSFCSRANETRHRSERYLAFYSKIWTRNNNNKQALHEWTLLLSEKFSFWISLWRVFWLFSKSIEPILIKPILTWSSEEFVEVIDANVSWNLVGMLSSV